MGSSLNWITEHTNFDDGSQFRDAFVEVFEVHDVKWQTSGKRHHSVLRIEEKYHEPIKRTFRKLRIDNPRLKKEYLLSLAVKACNDTLGPERAVPSVLVFGEFPSLNSFLGPKYQEQHQLNKHKPL